MCTRSGSIIIDTALDGTSKTQRKQLVKSSKTYNDRSRSVLYGGEVHQQPQTTKGEDSDYEESTKLLDVLWFA